MGGPCVSITDDGLVMTSRHVIYDTSYYVDDFVKLSLDAVHHSVQDQTYAGGQSRKN